MSVLFDISDSFFSSMMHKITVPIGIGVLAFGFLLYNVIIPGEKRSDQIRGAAISVLVMLGSLVMTSWILYVFVLHRIWLSSGEYLSVTGVVEDFVYSVERTNNAQKFRVNGVGFFYFPLEYGSCGPTSPDSVKSGMLVKIYYKNGCILRIEQIE